MCVFSGRAKIAGGASGTEHSIRDAEVTSPAKLPGPSSIPAKSRVLCALYSLARPSHYLPQTPEGHPSREQASKSKMAGPGLAGMVRVAEPSSS